MCPPAKTPPLPEIDPCCDTEQLILLLDKYTAGSNLPKNVVADLSPYQHPPSYLPEGIWYIVPSSEKKESNHGFWKAIGEPCKIYSNNSLTGWRTSLEYFEGGQKTNWVMQEYSITQKELCDEDRTKDSSLLCRIFFSCGPENCKTEDETMEIELQALLSSNINSPSSHDSLNESEAKCKCEMGELPKADNNKTGYSPQDSFERDCLSTGDFLELNDLVDHESESSSSQNSSCTSNLSDEYFDSMAFLLKEIEEDDKNYIHQEKQSSLKHSFTAPIEADDIVLQHGPSGSRLSDAGRTELIEEPQTGSKIENPIDITAPKRQNSEIAETTTSSGEKNVDGVGPSGEKKAGSGRLKKLKLYFCFSF